MPEWRWKGWAIQRAVEELRHVIHPDSLRSMTVVPIPPSKARDDPAYDDRMSQVAAGLCREPDKDWRELLIARESVVASHATDDRPGPNVIAANLSINEDLCAPTPGGIVLLDDVLTTGAHFVAGKRVLTERFPGIRIVGVFVARRRPAP